MQFVYMNESERIEGGCAQHTHARENRLQDLSRLLFYFMKLPVGHWRQGYVICSFCQNM